MLRLESLSDTELRCVPKGNNTTKLMHLMLSKSNPIEMSVRRPFNGFCNSSGCPALSSCLPKELVGDRGELMIRPKGINLLLGGRPRLLRRVVLIELSLSFA